MPKSYGDGVTWADLVRLTASDYGVHGLTDDAVEFILWEQTAFPFCDVPYLLDQLGVLFTVGPQENRPL